MARLSKKSKIIIIASGIVVIIAAIALFTYFNSDYYLERQYEKSKEQLEQATEEYERIKEIEDIIDNY